jgi:hypothetical protein
MNRSLSPSFTAVKLKPEYSRSPARLVNGAGWETIVTSAAGPGERRGGEGEGRRKGREGGGEGGDVCF